MMRIYNSFFTEHGYQRLSAWSNGVFALAALVIVIDLRTPINEVNLIMTETGAGLFDVLMAQAPRLLTYAMSLLTLGVFWVIQRSQLTYFERPRRRIIWTHTAFLVCVLILPFSTGLLFEFIRLRLALVVYWLNLLALGAALYMNWNYAERLKVLKSEVTPDFVQINKNRILTYEAMYTTAIALCAVNSTLSLVCLVFFQLIVAFAPRRVLDHVF